MQLKQLERCLDRQIRLSAEEWAFAWLLGEARRISNSARAPTADRGVRGNRSVDLHGALGELLLYGIVRRLGDPAALKHMRKQLYRAGGGRTVEGPDLRVNDDSLETGVDVKTFDCDPKKRFFAINDNKHSKLNGHCSGYVGLICPRFSRLACLTKLIPYEDVSMWKLSTLRENGSPSRNLGIDKAMRLYASRPYNIEESRRLTYSEREVLELARETGTVGTRLVRLIPEIEEAVREAQATL